MPYAEIKGVRLYYEDAGDQESNGGAPLVFVHGWCSDHTFFGPQMAHFARKHRVVAPDLRGCGRSDRPDGGYDTATFADDVAELCAHLSLESPVIIGHSMGGRIAVELAARHLSLPAAVIGVEPPLLDGLPKWKSGMANLVRRLEGPDGEAVLRGLFSAGQIDSEVRRKVIDMMGSVPLRIAIDSLRGTTAEWDGPAALAMCRVPLMVTLAGFDGSNDPGTLLRLKPAVMIGVTVGAGHFHHLEVPDQINAMIERFLEVVLA